jgi:acyl transferase domain-containing protein
MKRSTSLLNLAGDMTFTWDEPSDEKMVKIIKEMMDNGVRFFIVNSPGPSGIPLRLQTAEDAPKSGRSLAVMDEDLSRVKLTQNMISAGVPEALADLATSAGSGVTVEKSPVTKDHKVIKAAKTAEEAAATTTVAVKPNRGG